MHAIRPPTTSTLFSTPSALHSAVSLPHHVSVPAPAQSPPSSPPSSRAERSLRSVLERERRRPPPPTPPPPPPSRVTSPARTTKPLPMLWGDSDECDLVALVERSIALQAAPRRTLPPSSSLSGSLESPFASDNEEEKRSATTAQRRPRFSTSPRQAGYESDSGTSALRERHPSPAGRDTANLRLAAALAAASSSTLALPLPAQQPQPRAASHTAANTSARSVPLRPARASASATTTTPSPPSAFAPVIARIQSLSVIKRRERNPVLGEVAAPAQPPSTSTSAGGVTTTPPRLPFKPSSSASASPGLPSPRAAARIKGGPMRPSPSPPTTLPTPPTMSSPFRPGSPLPLPSPRPDPPPRPPSAPPRRPPRWRADSAPPQFLPSPPPTPPEDVDEHEHDNDGVGPLLVPELMAHAAPFDVEIAARRLRGLPGRICFDDVALPPPENDADDEGEGADGPRPRMGRRWSLW